MKSLDTFAEKIQDKTPIFEYYPPKNGYIGIVSIPHSGVATPPEFKSFLTDDENVKKQDVDFYVHNLVDISKFQDAGIAVIKANIIRTAIDLNRDKDTTVLNWKTNSRGMTVVVNEPSQSERTKLVQKYYSPYFEMLKALINELKTKMSKPSVIDLHSMPSKATEYHLKINPNQKIERPSFCVSDRSGLTCEKTFIDNVTQLLSLQYANTTQNDPYFGGHITQHIQDLFPDTNNIQIEINRSLYMDESNFELFKDTQDLNNCLSDVIINTFRKFS